MGAMFRSEEMVMCQLFVQPEAAYVSLYELGEAGIAQFRDLNPHMNDFQRRYVSEVRRCSEMERKLRWVAGELPEPPPPPDPSPRNLTPREINILEERIDYIESEIQEITRNAQNLKSDYLALIELKLLIEKMQTFFQDHSVERRISASVQVYNVEGGVGHLGFIAGVVATARVASFERMLWRISHGNVFFKQAQIDQPLRDPITGHPLMKTVFVVFFHGEQIKLRVKKVCHGFQATLYPCPATYKDQQEMLAGVTTRIKDLEMVLGQTEDHRRLVLTNIAKDISTWMVAVRKEKAIYHTLNMFSMDIIKKCLIAECWVPKKDMHIIQNALDNGVKASGSPIPSFINYVPTREVPPTFNRTNKFTKGFQNLIDSYGIASYREVNPALYTIITFPFLFAVMFGDLGHGFLMTTFAAILVIFEKHFSKIKSDNEIWTIFFGGRYIILLMGCFSMYTGLIYNDVFAKSINIFGSSWTSVYDNQTLQTYEYLQLDPVDSYSNIPYPFGIDPVWQLAENNIIFLNSFKMKLSIIFGVIHMAFGVTMSVVNFNYFKKPSLIFLVYIPQILFLLLLFWYLCILMFLKWIMYSTESTDPAYGSSCAPAVLIIFINMMLFKKTEATPPCLPHVFPGQEVLQKAFLFVAFLCIPVMLLGKPIYKVVASKTRKRKYGESLEEGTQLEPAESKEEDSLSEALIEQTIHTIEYVLGTVSHTASYLRLWALSLAHAQLSAVLWKQVMIIGLRGGSPVNSILLFVIFAIWAFFTLAILVVMEGLSAFLHTLRLHWVEFMSKFYEGHGYAFSPFSFCTILEQDEEEKVVDKKKVATRD